jgi:DNA-binding NarL/FixJ family response regulator
MAKQRIILVNESRLMRDMLKKVINKSPGLEIVIELTDLADLPETARQIEAEWAIVLLPPDQQVPDLVEQVVKEQQSMRFLLMGVDGSHARMKWNEPHEVPLDEKNLNELLDVLRQEKPKPSLQERIKA